MAVSLVIIVIAVLLLAGLVLSFFAVKLKREEYKVTGKYPKGHYMGQGIAIGIGIGIPIAIATGSIFGGYLVGLIAGTIIGARMENKHESELRPLTQKEKDLRKKSVLIFGALLIVGIILILTSVY